MKNERNENKKKEKCSNGRNWISSTTVESLVYPRSLSLPLPLSHSLFNASTWRMSDLYARTKLQINLLKMIVKAVPCAGVHFETLSLSLLLSPKLSAWLHAAFMQYAGIFAQKYWWFGKCALKRQNPLSCSRSSYQVARPASQAWLLPVGINLLPVAKHLTSWLKSYRIATQHNAKHGKRISKTESQTQTEWEQSEHGRALKSVAYFAARA